ncbi:MAG: YceI family protein [Myxococcota bacterium]
MIVFTQADGHIWVETRREGMLAPVGHDLRLEAQAFRVQVTPDLTSVTATIQAASVTVRAALMGVQEHASALGRLERGRINRTIAKDVLKSREFSTITFSSDSLSEAEAGYALTGQLTLRGVSRSVMTTAFREGSRLHARLPLRLSAFGLRPVTAFMGALRVSDELCVVIDLPDSS